MSLRFAYTDPVMAGPAACEAPVAVDVRDIASGDAGIMATLAAMRQLIRESEAHPEVRKHAERAVTGVSWLDEASVVAALAAYVRAVTVYRPDPVGSEYLQAPWVVLCWVDAGRQPALDCDDQVMLVLALLRSLGIDGAFRVVSYDADQEFGHVYAVARLSTGQDIPVDLTLAAMPMGFRPPQETRAIEVEIGP